MTHNDLVTNDQGTTRIEIRTEKPKKSNWLYKFIFTNIATESNRFCFVFGCQITHFTAKKTRIGSNFGSCSTLGYFVDSIMSSMEHCRQHLFSQNLGKLKVDESDRR